MNAVSTYSKGMGMRQKAAERSIEIPVDSAVLTGDLIIPTVTTSIVIFAHGSGSSRRSPRNRFVASVLQDASMSTLLFDLLTVEEDTDYEMRFNRDLLTERLEVATLWVQAQPDLSSLPLGYFGASTGAAAALGAAADLPEGTFGSPDDRPKEGKWKMSDDMREVISAIALRQRRRTSRSFWT